ncbi:S9 family peptidase [Qipengyuania sp. 1NDH17]|uniref:S9 family peptidase n=1 Tax=Qipengyuania polymorpha TaxID=2867234 RepID=A0ABS7J2Z8_9SPHN|nr:S9 family peptidase [Qipengyuania polymorpha]MBX7459147.1 S9 family peptidase [Qipengyuania polymorpha]
MLRKFTFVAAVSLAAMTLSACSQGIESTPVAAAPDMATYTAAQFFESTSYGVGSSSGYTFSADGEYILVNSDQSGVFNAYMMPVGGGEAIPLTTSTDNATFGSSFFPNDNRLLFTADEGGNELNHLYVRTLDGSMVDLTPGEDLKASFAGWNAEGTVFFATTNERDSSAFDLYAYDTLSFARSRIFTNEGGFSIADVSPDGRWVALTKANSSADSDIYLADLQGDATPKLISAHEGNVSHGVYTFTRESDALVYGTDEHGEFSEAWRYNLATGKKRVMLEEDWDVSYVSYSPSGRYRISGVNEDALTAVTILDTLTDKEMKLKGLPAGNLGSIRFDEEEKRIAFTLSSDTSPTDIYLADLKSGNATRLTSALNPAIDEGDLVTATVARFKSYDGVEIPGILYKPKGASAANPAPMVVLVHGGPGGQSRRGYSPMIQHLVNNGYAIYAINNRGSSGYGKTFFHMDDKRHGDVDLKDVVASKGFLQGLDWVADDRIAVMGGSYGGYMTAAALAFHPQVFDAGINIFGVTNWVRTLESIPPWWGSFRDALYDEMGDPATDAERHRAISPLFHAGNIVKPLLVVQGANDPRVLQVESDELVEAVRANGVPVEYVLFPDEGHGFRRKENRITASEAYLAFLDEHIGR